MIALSALIGAYLALCCALALYGWIADRPGPAKGVVVVLGGGARNGRLVASGLARVAAGVAALSPGQHIHFTGGMEGGGSEAALMAAEAIRLGVSPAQITQEGRSRSTQQNALFSQERIGDRPITLVTDRFHLARAQMLFRAHGYHVAGLRGSGFRRTRRRALWFFAREGLSGTLNAGRLIAWGTAKTLGASRDWRIRHLT